MQAANHHCLTPLFYQMLPNRSNSRYSGCGMGALDHLIRDYAEPVKDPLWNNILLSPALLRLIALPAFQKLNGIRQLGPTYLVYPGATHTRLSHSLGVFHLARRLMLNLLAHAEAPGRMPEAAREPEAVRAFLCAALLHDLGHYPFAHSLKELQVASHESLTAARVLEPDFSGVLRREVGADPELVAAIVDARRAGPGGEALAFYRRLLSGVLDPDKLDYLNRDAYFCGVPHGVQDVDFALAELRALPAGLGVTRKGLTAVESILFSKYLMYRSVYWHKTVRIATAMIKKAVLLALEAGALQSAQLYGLDDQEFFALASRSAFPPLQLAGRVARRQLFKQVASRPLDPADPADASLAGLPARLAAEQAIAREASRELGRPVPAWNIIIDVPEPISFEIDLPVLDAGESRPFADADSVFTEATVRGFGRSLRRASLIAEADAELAAALERLGGSRLLRAQP
jgi:HD superfamily phosphohydrolase